MVGALPTSSYIFLKLGDDNKMATSVMKKKVSMSGKSKESELQVYCRKCTKIKSSKEFYTKVDDLDSNGFMSICKECCGQVYDNSYAVERSFERALLRTCKILNLAWVPNAVDATKNHMDKGKARGQEEFSVFGIYKSKLMTLANLAGDKALTFEEYPTQESLISNTPEQEENETYQELQDFWGKRPYEDVQFLQKEFNALGGADAFKDDRPKAILLREICFQMLDIEKSRDGAGVEKKVKVLAELMGSSAIRPDQKKVADGSKSAEAYGLWLADIERYKPCEWYKDKSIYKDVDNIKNEFETHVLRPFLNFWGFQKDFNFEGAVDTTEALSDDSVYSED
jgi:hypothetical protein